MKTTQRMKNTQMSVFSICVCIASEYCSPAKAADDAFLLLRSRVFVNSPCFVSCVIFISLIKLLCVFNTVSSTAGVTVVGLACGSDSLALKLFSY